MSQHAEVLSAPSPDLTDEAVPGAPEFARLGRLGPLLFQANFGWMFATGVSGL
jgi:hypothetical protein